MGVVPLISLRKEQDSNLNSRVAQPFATSGRPLRGSRRNPTESRTIAGISGQKSVPEKL